MAQNAASAAAELFTSFPHLEIIHVKLGKRGSRIFTRDTDLEVPAYPIEKICAIVDPTGAGDYFDAGFVSGLANGTTLEEAASLAAKAGAVNAAAFGPMGGNLRKMPGSFPL